MMTVHSKLILAIVLLGDYIHAYIPHEVHVTETSHDYFYPIAKPYHEAYIPVSPIHTLYYAEFGNPRGVPVLVVHGGPGAGCSQEWSRFFDPSFYRVVMLDQRASGKSTPVAEMTDNDPMHLVADIELLRNELAIDQWVLFGGSWGSALSLLYAQAVPERVQAMVLRGVFLARKIDYEHLLYGMKQHYPEAWDDMIHVIGASEDDDLISYLHEPLMNPDPQVHMPPAQAFMRFDTICGTLLPSPALVAAQAAGSLSTLGLARAFIHYAKHGFFMEPNQLLDNMNSIKHISTIIVHGRYDMICRLETAYTLYKKFPSAALWIVPDAGHFSTEPSIARNLCYAMDVIKEDLRKN